MIECYRFGSMIVNGVQYLADLKIIKGKVIPNWWRKQRHVVGPDDVADIIQASPQILVVGKGSPGLMEVDPKLRNILDRESIELIELPTSEAVIRFNQLWSEGRDVAGAFHLTC